MHGSREEVEGAALPMGSTLPEGTARWRLLDNLLDQALDLQGEARARFVEEECPEALRAELEHLIESENASALDVEKHWGGMWQGAADAITEPARELGVGDTVGPWKLAEMLGRGGMGTVFLADRVDGQFDMRAAVKISHQPRHDLASRERFERERQILARLQHDSIARLLDGGMTEEGRPYFVMEHVEGEPLDAYCDRRRLSVEARLALFVRLARGVEAAHRQLVVHRDLKPANTLVTPLGEPKLLDFGIAKLLEDTDAAGGGPQGSAVTMTRLMTPEYASPEQLLGGSVGVGTDVYQLGVMLYELLTGLPPHRFEGDSASRMLLRVCQEPAMAPSRRVGVATRGDLETRDRPLVKTEPVLAAAAARRPAEPTTPASGLEQAERRASLRRTTPRRLARRLEGDLDVIVGKALDKDANRRYGSVAELLDDIERHLDGLPILARPDTLAYRGTKFLMRHSLAVGFATATVALLITLVTFYTLRLEDERNQAVAAQQEAESARIEAEQRSEESDAVVDFLRSLFTAADPKANNGREITVAELLERGSERLGTDLSDQPLVRIRLQLTIARVYDRLGRHDEASALLTDAREASREQISADDPERIRALRASGINARFRSDFEASENHFREALELLDAHPESWSELHGDLLNSYANMLVHQGRLDEAKPIFQRCLATQEGHPDTTDEKLSFTLVNFGLLYIRTGELDLAEQYLERAKEIEERIYGVGHVETAATLNNLAIIAFRRGDWARAAVRMERVLDIRRKALGNEHADVAGALSNVGLAKSMNGDLEGAKESLHEALGIFEAALGDDHFRLVTPLEGLAHVALEQDDPQEAEPWLLRGLALREKHQSPRHPDLARTLSMLGLVYEGQGRASEAETQYLRGMDICRQEDGTLHPNAAQVEGDLGGFYLRQGRLDEAISTLQSSLARFEELFGPGHPQAEEVIRMLDEARAAQLAATGQGVG